MTRPHEEDPVATVELCGNFLRLRWSAAGTIDESAARAAIAKINELSAGQALPVLVEVNGTSPTRQAGDVFATEWPLVRTALVGKSPVDEVIAAFYTARHRPACPTRFFASRTQAKAWLTERHEDPTAGVASTPAAEDSTPGSK